MGDTNLLCVYTDDVISDSDCGWMVPLLVGAYGCYSDIVGTLYKTGWIVHEYEKIVGIVLIGPCGPSWKEPCSNLLCYVHPENRGRGIGLKALENIMLQSQTRYCYGFSLESNVFANKAVRKHIGAVFWYPDKDSGDRARFAWCIDFQEELKE